MRHLPKIIGGTVAAVSLGLASPQAADQQPQPPRPQPRASMPSVDALISLERAQSPAISPDGRYVAYVLRQVNWDDNEYETEIWLADLEGQTVRQLTSGPKSSSSPAWSPDSQQIAFVSDRQDRRQIYVINRDGGEAQLLTNTTGSIGRFAWAPNGTAIAFTVTETGETARRTRERTWGEFRVIDAEHRMAQLRVINLDGGQSRRLTEDAFTVGAFAWSPDSTRIAFDHRVNPDPASNGTANISVINVADGAMRTVVGQAGPDQNPVWSPDGSLIAFETSMANPGFFYSNTRIATIPAGGGQIRNVTPGFDEDCTLVAWRPSGIHFSASQRTNAYLYRLQPQTGELTHVMPRQGWVGSEFTLDATGQTTAFVGADATNFPEVYVGSLEGAFIRRLTETGRQVSGWVGSTREVITWTSQDGTEIEGVLHKPGGFEAGRRYPLLVVIHGGPTGISRPIPYASTRIYPIDIWLGRGAIVLEPNYRGSAGYGEKFRSLNVRNLGIGDAWDVISGIDHLIAEGLADRDRIGVMGWSQGGYISAFLATHDSARFKAISVGAGISNWMTYYVNTDIHPFTRQYLKATPWDDPEIYAKTSPMTYIKGASAPTLIQHGEADQRVPPPNAFELYQGLRDMGVTTKLVIYAGFGGTGHGPTRPRSSRALMQHNLDWFDEHLFLRK